MELTSYEVRRVTFREAWRGYDRSQVDDFLERIAAGLDQLEGQLRRTAAAGAAASEDAPQPASVVGDAEAATRTLVLAQRTADAALADARAEAERLVAEAQERAHAIVAEAEAGAPDLARRAHEEHERQLLAEVTALEARRAGLQQDCEALERYLADERERVRASLDALTRRLDAGDAPIAASRPALHDDARSPAPTAAEPAAPMAEPERPDEVAWPSTEEPPFASADPVTVDEPDAIYPPRPEPRAAEDPPATDEAPPGVDRSSVVAIELDDEATRPVPIAAGGTAGDVVGLDEATPSEASADRARGAVAPDDAFFDELRMVLDAQLETSDAPASTGERPGPDARFFDQDVAGIDRPLSSAPWRRRGR